MIKINLHHLSPLFCELVAAQVDPRHSCAGCHLNHNHNHNHDENNGIAFHHNAIWLILMMCWIHLRVRRSRTASHDAKPNLITESESEKVKKSPCVIFSCPNSSMPTLVIIMHIGCYRFKAFQTKPKSCKTDGGHEETWPDEQKHNDKDKCKDKDNDNDNYI